MYGSVSVPAVAPSSPRPLHLWRWERKGKGWGRGGGRKNGYTNLRDARVVWWVSVGVSRFVCARAQACLACFVTINTQRRDHRHRTSIHPRSCELCLCLVTLVIDTLLKIIDDSFLALCKARNVHDNHLQTMNCRPEYCTFPWTIHNLHSLCIVHSISLKFCFTEWTICNF